MKKWVMLLAVCLAAGVAGAQTSPVKVGGVYLSDPVVANKKEYSGDELMRKVKNMEMLDFARMPSVFWYASLEKDLNNQHDINVFYMAKNRYEKNPKNFNAVFNYATVIMSPSWGEGVDLSEREVDEAYRLLDLARKMRPSSLPVYRQMDFLLMYKILGPVWFGPGYTDEEAIELYRRVPDLARKRLAVQEKLIAAGEGDVYTAWHICKSLNRTKCAAKYRKMADELDAQIAQRRAEEQQQMQAQRKAAIRTLSNMLKDGIEQTRRKIQKICRFGKCD